MKYSPSIWQYVFSKVKTLWEGHNIWKNLPLVLMKQLFLPNSLKTSGIFFSNFVAFSENLNFNMEMIILDLQNFKNWSPNKVD